MASCDYFRDMGSDEKEVKMKYFNQFFRKASAGPKSYLIFPQNLLKEATFFFFFFAFNTFLVLISGEQHPQRLLGILERVLLIIP